MRKKRTYKVAELFCGCGGFSHGFALTNRFDVVFGNDIKKEALNTFIHNHHNGSHLPESLLGDIRTVSTEALKYQIEHASGGSLDCLIGGPPCQGFSQMRRSEERQGTELSRFGGYNKLDEDPRNDLVLRFLEVAQALKPSVVIIENVPQMLTHHYKGQKAGLASLIRNLLEDMGYKVDGDVVNAADYGVPQLRERAIIMASNIGILNLPRPSHGDGNSSYVTVRDAISDLPLPVPVGTPEPPLTELGKDISTDDYIFKMRGHTGIAANHFTRAYQQRILDIIREMRPGETWDSASSRMREKYAQATGKEAATNSPVDIENDDHKPDDQINRAFYKKYYWSAYTRLHWDMPALTITANANFLGSGRFTHPTQDRGITMREAARLQSFNDDFIFYTSEKGIDCRDNIGLGMDMIGEAVPPLLGKVIAESVIKHLDRMSL